MLPHVPQLTKGMAFDVTLLTALHLTIFTMAL